MSFDQKFATEFLLQFWLELLIVCILPHGSIHRSFQAFRIQTIFIEEQKFSLNKATVFLPKVSRGKRQFRIIFLSFQ